MHSTIRRRVIVAIEHVVGRMWDDVTHPKHALEERTRKVVDAIHPPLTDEERRSIAETVVARRIVRATLRNQPSHFDHIMRALNTDAVTVRLTL